MINNRQGGRRRGRGGQRPQGGMGGQPGNRQDNRQRGNAAQLLEKYKSLARDSQLAGDRVQTEYYLQYAEHYFRVLGESRARYEEQRRQRGEDPDDDDGDDDLVEAGADDGAAEGGSDERRYDRGDRSRSRDRGRERSRYSRDDREDRDERNGEEQAEQPDERIAFEALPPAIGRDDVEAGEAEEAPRPRRRTRRPRAAEGDGEVAPAA